MWQGQAYRFTHYLFVSRVYRLSPEEEEALLAAQRDAKRYRSNPQTKQRKDSVYGFHPEDEEIMQVSVLFAVWRWLIRCSTPHTR